MESETSTAVDLEPEGLISRARISDNAVAITMHSTSNYLVVSLDNNTLHIFNSDGGLLFILRSPKSNVWSLALTEDTLLCGEVSGEIQKWDLMTR